MEWVDTGEVSYIRHEMDGATVAFGTRRSGVSTAPYSSLNVGIGTGDSAELVASNRSALSRAVDLDPSSVVMARQVHGDEILHHRATDPNELWARGVMPELEADGHITAVSGIGLAVITADCLPIAMKGERGLALVHCGWRGLADGLAQKAAGLIRAEVAAIGPGIGPCCYEVREDVSARLEDHAGALSEGMLDLVRVGREQLESAGVREIESSGLCTCCEDEDFFSHRRDGEKTGRQGTLAWLN